MRQLSVIHFFCDIQILPICNEILEKFIRKEIDQVRKKSF